MTVGTYLLVFGFLIWLYFIWTRRRFYMFALKFPGPWGLPFVGILHKLVPQKDVLYRLPKIATNYNSKSAFTWIGTVPYFYTYDPNIIEKILSSRNCTDKTSAFEILDREIGQGLLSSKTQRWTKHRKLLGPTFHHKVLLKFFPIFNSKSKELLEKFNSFVGGGEFDLNDLFQRFTIQTAIATTLDFDISEKNERDAEYISHVQNHLRISIDRSLAPWRKINAIFYFNKFYNSYVASRKYIYSFITDLINEKFKKMESLYLNDSTEDKVDITKSRKIFIDQAVELYRTNLFSWKDVFIESNVLVLAAFETSASSLYTVLMLLAMHPQYQEKLYEELKLVFPDGTDDVNFEDLQQLVYLDMIINETLRVAATIPLLGRDANGGDVKISENLSIPQGTSILIDIFNLHRDEDVWGPHAKEFNPDNFLPQNLDGKHAYGFIPFSKGPRNCIGWRYAEMFLKVILSKIIRNFKVTTTSKFEDIRFTMNMSLRCEVMPQIEVHRRCDVNSRE
ncbi:probable cytochrome P450 313a4 [Episyrphus balteatus]|uniref:probable cytochrome P450 313a4 n=1 Tax=Episyrphus balteatus TaxID=286459 RepID=UPI0024861A44|nr:probable cytochrome P450 313a4 [Episyrphus balteatus]